MTVIKLDEQISVNEMFASVQGEANFTGTPATFIRFQGCRVGCSFCDTKHTWTTDRENRVVSILSKTAIEENSWSHMTPAEIRHQIGTNKWPAHVVITGGEPVQQYDRLKKLVDTLLIGLGPINTVQIETSGITLDGSPVLREDFDVAPPCRLWFTFSPKVEKMVSPVPDWSIAPWDEIKLPIGKASDFDKFLPYYENAPVPVWFQPISENKKATELCIRKAAEGSQFSKRDWRVSIQTHKQLGVR